MNRFKMLLLAVTLAAVPAASSLAGMFEGGSSSRANSALSPLGGRQSSSLRRERESPGSARRPRRWHQSARRRGWSLEGAGRGLRGRESK